MAKKSRKPPKAPTASKKTTRRGGSRTSSNKSATTSQRKPAGPVRTPRRPRQPGPEDSQLDLPEGVGIGQHPELDRICKSATVRRGNRSEQDEDEADDMNQALAYMDERGLSVYTKHGTVLKINASIKKLSMRPIKDRATVDIRPASPFDGDAEAANLRDEAADEQ